MAIAAVANGVAVTPVNTHQISLDIPIPATVLGDDLVAAFDIGDDPTAPATVTDLSVPFEGLLLEDGSGRLLLETGSELLLESSSNVAGSLFTLLVALTNSHARAELWSLRNIPTGITRLRATFSTPTVAVGHSEEYSGVQALGITATASGTGANPSIALVTQDTNNVVVGTFSKEGIGVSAFTGSLQGTSRSIGYALGNGIPDVAGILLDNTNALPASVTCQGANADAFAPWAGVALELRTVAPTTSSAMQSADNRFLRWLVYGP